MTLYLIVSSFLLHFIKQTSCQQLFFHYSYRCLGNKQFMLTRRLLTMFCIMCTVISACVTMRTKQWCIESCIIYPSHISHPSLFFQTVQIEKQTESIGVAPDKGGHRLYLSFSVHFNVKAANPFFFSICHFFFSPPSVSFFLLCFHIHLSFSFSPCLMPLCVTFECSSKIEKVIGHYISVFPYSRLHFDL